MKTVAIFGLVLIALVATTATSIAGSFECRECSNVTIGDVNETAIAVGNVSSIPVTQGCITTYTPYCCLRINGICKQICYRKSTVCAW